MDEIIGVIGGTGLYAMMDDFEMIRQEIVSTPFGEASAPLVFGRLQGREVVFLARHGFTHRLPPHQINYRANLWMLKKARVGKILSVNAVGSINRQCAPETLVIPDQIIDYSWGREQTFYAQDLERVVHVDFTYPYAQGLRETLFTAAQNIAIPVTKNGTYGCTQGPRLETAAEVTRLERDGCDLVGMTGMPEAALARELSMQYASVSVVANWAAGLTGKEITMQQIELHLQNGMEQAKKLIAEAIRISD